MMTTAMAPKEEKVATERKATRKEEKAPNTTLLETTMTMITFSMAPKGGKAARNATMTRFLAIKGGKGGKGRKGRKNNKKRKKASK